MADMTPRRRPELGDLHLRGARHQIAEFRQAVVGGDRGATVAVDIAEGDVEADGAAQRLPGGELTLDAALSAALVDPDFVGIEGDVGDVGVEVAVVVEIGEFARRDRRPAASRRWPLSVKLPSLPP